MHTLAHTHTHTHRHSQTAPVYTITETMFGRMLYTKPPPIGCHFLLTPTPQLYDCVPITLLYQVLIKCLNTLYSPAPVATSATCTLCVCVFEHWTIELNTHTGMSDNITCRSEFAYGTSDGQVFVRQFALGCDDWQLVRTLDGHHSDITQVSSLRGCTREDGVPDFSMYVCM